MVTSTKRPLTVTVICWFFMLWAFFSVIPKVFLLIDPAAYRQALDLSNALSNQGFLHIPLWFQLAHAFFGVPVIIVSGIFMLKGRFWAFAAFLIWIFGVIVLTLAVSGLSCPFEQDQPEAGPFFFDAEGKLADRAFGCLTLTNGGGRRGN